MSTGSGRFLLILHDAKDGTEAGRAALRARLSTLLHLSPEALNAIFATLPVIIQYDLSADLAERSVELFESVGAEVEALEGHPGRALPAPGQAGLAILESPEVKLALALLLERPSAHASKTAPSPAIAPLTLNDDTGVDDLERLLDDALLETEPVLDVSATDNNEPLGVSIEELTRMLEAEESLPPPNQNASSNAFELSLDEPSGVSRPDVYSTLLDEPVAALSPEPTMSESPPEPEAPPASSMAEDETVNLPELRTAFLATIPPQDSPHLPQPFAFGAPSDTEVDEDEEEEEEDDRPPWRGIPKNRQLVFGTAIVAVFMLVLGVYRFLLVSNEESITLTLTPEALNALLKEQRSILDRSNEGSELPKNRFSWTGENNQGSISSRVTLLEQNGVPISVDLSIRQTAAGKRSLKEIADGVPPPVWIRLCVAQNMVVSAGEAPGALLFHGTAKAYLSDEERNARAVVNVNGKMWREADRYVGSWALTLNSDGSPEQPEYILEREKLEYTIKVAGTFIAKDRTKILRERPYTSKPSTAQTDKEKATTGKAKRKAANVNDGEAVDGEASSETEG